MSEKLKKRLILVLKIVISLGGLLVVFTKIDYVEAIDYLLGANYLWIFIGVLFFILSKVIAAFRLNFYLETLAAKLPTQYNLKLYLLGMFYNLFLPGGIGGDGYKVYIINKEYGTSKKQLIGAMLVDRMSGVVAICVLMCLLFAYLGDVVSIYDFQFGAWSYLSILLIPIGVSFYYFVVKRFFPYLITVFSKTTILALGVQLSQLMTMVCLLMALGENENWLSYLLIFLLSSIMAALPLTIGGAGARELTFIFGAEWFGLQETIAFSVSILFYLTQVFVSFFGIFYVFKLKKEQESPLLDEDILDDES